MSLTPNNFDTSSYVEPGPALQPATASPQPIPAAAVDDSSFAWGIIGGIAGVIMGAIFYAAFIGAIHRGASILSVLVAFMVAKGIMMGSRAKGGFQYQVTAIVMTCAAVALGNAVMLYVMLNNRQPLDPSLHNIAVLLKYGAAEPIMRFQTSALRGVIGLVFLFGGLRAAWRMTSGDPEAMRHPFARW